MALRARIANVIVRSRHSTVNYGSAGGQDTAGPRVLGDHDNRFHENGHRRLRLGERLDLVSSFCHFSVPKGPSHAVIFAFGVRGSLLLGLHELSSKVRVFGLTNVSSGVTHRNRYASFASYTGLYVFGLFRLNGTDGAGSPTVRFRTNVRRKVFGRHNGGLVLYILGDNPILLVRFYQPHITLYFIIPRLTRLPNRGKPNLSGLLGRPFLVIDTALLVHVPPET